MMDYMVNNLHAFIFECGRTQGILQSDNEDTLNALLKATAAKVGSMTVRHSPSYSSNSQGSVERLHRTLLGHIRVVKAQVESNCSMTMSTKRCLLPWIVRHAAWTANRYVIHSDGYRSFERRWGRNYERAICEFGETLLYLPPQHKKLPKADLRMQKCIWLGKVSETGENYVATESGVQKVRKVRRLQPDFKCDLALLNKVSGTPWAPRRNTYNPSFAILLDTSGRRKSPRVALSHPSHPQPLGTTHIRLCHPMRFKSPHFLQKTTGTELEGRCCNPKNSPHTARTCSKLTGLGSC